MSLLKENVHLSNCRSQKGNLEQTTTTIIILSVSNGYGYAFATYTKISLNTLLNASVATLTLRKANRLARVTQAQSLDSLCLPLAGEKKSCKEYSHLCPRVGTT